MVNVMNIVFLNKKHKGNILLSTMVFSFFLFFSLSLVLVDHFRVQTFYIHSINYYQAKTMRLLAVDEILSLYEKNQLPSEGSYFFESGQVNYEIKEAEGKRWIQLKIRMKNRAVFGEVEKIAIN